MKDIKDTIKVVKNYEEKEKKVRWHVDITTNKEMALVPGEQPLL